VNAELGKTNSENYDVDCACARVRHSVTSLTLFIRCGAAPPVAAKIRLCKSGTLSGTKYSSYLVNISNVSSL